MPKKSLFCADYMPAASLHWAIFFRRRENDRHTLLLREWNSIPPRYDKRFFLAAIEWNVFGRHVVCTGRGHNDEVTIALLKTISSISVLFCKMDPSIGRCSARVI